MLMNASGNKELPQLLYSNEFAFPLYISQVRRDVAVGDDQHGNMLSAHQRSTLETRNMHFITPLTGVDSTSAHNIRDTNDWGIMNISHIRIGIEISYK